MKKVGNAILVLIFVLGLAWATNYFSSLFFKEPIGASELGELLSGVAAAIAVFYVIVEYISHLKEKRNNQLSLYNQRYAEDKYIAKVTRWMLRTALYDENGKIIGKDPKKEVKEEEIPDIFDKEMFMRFFEELNIQIDSHLLNEEDTLRMFAYYALAFDEYESFREEITDYNRADTWHNFHQFIDKTKRTRSFLEITASLKKSAFPV